MSEKNPFTELALRRNPAAQKNQPRYQVSSTQVMFAAILAVALMLTINFSSRITADRELRKIRDQVLQEIGLLEREQALLQAELEFTESEAYIEQWARSEGRMVKDGEILVIPIPAETTNGEVAIAPATEPNFVFETTSPDIQPWQLWWSLFFDTRPPS